MKSIVKITASLLAVLCICGCVHTTALARLSGGVACLAEGQTMILGGRVGEPLTFDDGAFRQFFGVSDYPDITFESLPDPTEGVIKFDGLRVAVGQTVHRREISKLVFTPANGLVSESSFTFTAGNLRGGEVVKCIIRLTDQNNQPPTTEGSASPCFAVRTQKNISVFGTLAGYDPDGDEMEYLIVSYPQNGSVAVTDAGRGDFRYTPKKGYTGKDKFTYVIRDAFGHYSVPAEVQIVVDKRAIDLEFSDMQGSKWEGAALEMVAKRVMGVRTGENGVCFDPRGTVTRAEWVAMALRAAGVPALPVHTTYFEDDGEIPVALKPYIAAACQRGYVIGTFRDGGLYLDPNEAISRGEACEILMRVLSCDVTQACHAFADTALLSRGELRAMGSLYLAGILPTQGGCALPDGALTREVAAAMLQKTARYGVENAE